MEFRRKTDGKLNPEHESKTNPLSDWLAVAESGVCGAIVLVGRDQGA